jgi:osmotically-inducible protein OsmY
MTRTNAGRLSAVLFAVLIVAAIPAGAGAAEHALATVDVTPAIASGVNGISGLSAIEVGDIVVLRGRTTSRDAAVKATTLVQALGYQRVANLIQVIEPADDATIMRVAERQLGMSRSLAGCNFKVDSNNGVVRLGGTVQSELQKDMAVAMLRNIDGVKVVTANLITK